MQQRLTITEKHVNVFRGLRLRPKGSHETDHVNDVLGMAMLLFSC